MQPLWGNILAQWRDGNASRPGQRSVGADPNGYYSPVRGDRRAWGASWKRLNGPSMVVSASEPPDSSGAATAPDESGGSSVAFAIMRVRPCATEDEMHPRAWAGRPRAAKTADGMASDSRDRVGSARGTDVGPRATGGLGGHRATDRVTRCQISKSIGLGRLLAVFGENPRLSCNFA